MDWVLGSITFIATITIMGALAYAFVPGELEITGRLSRLLNATAPVRESEFKGRQKERMLETLASVGQMISSKPVSSKSQLMLARAGFRSPRAIQAIMGFRILLPLVLAAIVVFSGLYRWNPFFVLAAAAITGYMLPEMWFLGRIRARKHKLRQAVPDGLDLLVICVEAGLGLDQALLRVSQELQITHPEFSDELQIVTAEMRLGKTRTDPPRGTARSTRWGSRPWISSRAGPHAQSWTTTSSRTSTADR